MDTTTDLARAFIARSRAYLCDEYRIKIRRAVEALPDGMLWARANDKSNSVGNLLMHLEGNVRQYIVGGVGGAADVRDRPAEFAAQGGVEASELLARMDRVLDEADAALARLDPATLLERRTIQGRETTLHDAIYQVVQHFALHAGQIFLVAKERVPGSIRFYEDMGAVARPIWK